MNYCVRSACRLCGAGGLKTVLELASTPLANEFTPEVTLPADRELFPLYLVRCDQCGHVQLPVVVKPERLFSNYVYVSGTSPTFVEHFRQYAQEMIQRLGLVHGNLVVEIGSNDGTLLGFFKAAGMRVIGVDPAEKIAATATAAGIPTIAKFFDPVLAQSIRDEHGPATLVIANNVFAHADNLHAIVQGVGSLLDSKRGLFVFEVQYLLDMVEQTLFDMVYHEHLSYHSIAPLIPFFESLSMCVTDVAHVRTHGGSIRVFVSSCKSSQRSHRMEALLTKEAAAFSGNVFETLQEQIKIVHQRVQGFFAEARRNQWKVVGFGAPAKLTTLAYEFGITADDMVYVVDDSPWKQGLFTPGSGIPVVPASRLNDDPPDRIMLFAWNFAEQIAAKHPQFSGRFVVPLPNFRLM